MAKLTDLQSNMMSSDWSTMKRIKPREPAIKREKQIKKWNRQWKLRLIEEDNPDWKDLFGLIV